MDMPENYILNRLRIDARHVLTLADHERAIGHPGVKGRFRELFVNNLLVPWLPPAVGCGTGIIIDHEQNVVEAGQEDVVLFDALLGPQILASPHATDGVFLFDNALCRIEVKSILTQEHLKDFAKTSLAIANLKRAARGDDERSVFATLNLLLGFTSNVAEGREGDSLQNAMLEVGIDPLSGVVSGMCIADRGYWVLGEMHERGNMVRCWKRLIKSTDDDPLAYFVGFTSNSCFDQRAARQGLSPLGGGIGMYLDHPFEPA